RYLARILLEKKLVVTVAAGLNERVSHPSSTRFTPTLVLTDSFLPSLGGSINWLLNTYSRYHTQEVMFVAPQCSGDKIADRGLPFRVHRVSTAMAEWDPTVPRSFMRYIEKVWHVHKICRKDYVEQIHCAKILPEGFIACCIQYTSAIPYLVYA